MSGSSGETQMPNGSFFSIVARVLTLPLPGSRKRVGTTVKVVMDNTARRSGFLKPAGGQALLLRQRPRLVVQG
jgi:hypothetical protein